MSHESGTVIQICLDQPTLTALSLLAGNRGGTVETEIRQAVTNHLCDPRYPVQVESNGAALLALPTSVLNLTVRARKVMNRLGIKSLGDLTQYSPCMLLEAKNFGTTSLIEVETKLKQYGLSLREEP